MRRMILAIIAMLAAANQPILDPTYTITSSFNPIVTSGGPSATGVGHVDINNENWREENNRIVVVSDTMALVDMDYSIEFAKTHYIVQIFHTSTTTAFNYTVEAVQPDGTITMRVLPPTMAGFAITYFVVTIEIPRTFGVPMFVLDFQ